MIIIPAIDLMNGQCVRLYQGKFDQSTQVANDPKQQLLRFIDDGAKRIHIVDLDGARSGRPEQKGLISELIKTSTVPVQVGGGIRHLESIKSYADAGAQGIILGTSALEDRQFTAEALKAYKDKVIIGIDAINGNVATKGWENITTRGYIEFAKEMDALGAQKIIYTDISKDGTMTGPNLKELELLNKAVSCTIVASGGITSNQDLKNLEEIGIEEAIVGKAIYQGTIRLQEMML